MTTLTVTGRVTGEPELRFTSSGKAVANFNLADNHRRKDGEQWVQDGATFYRVTCWEYLAQQVADRLAKGQRVQVTGEIRNREYEAKDGGKARSLEIRAHEIAVPLDKYPPRDAGQAPAASSGWGAALDATEPPF